MDERIVTGASGVLSMVLYVDDEGTYATGGVVVRVTRDGDGAYLTAGTGYSAAASGTDASGYYEITIGPQTCMGTLTCEWVATTSSGHTTTVTTHAEIVGGRLCTIADVRNSDPTLVDSTKYPTNKVWAAVRETEDEFERILGCGVIPRATTEYCWGGGASILLSHRPLIGIYGSVSTGTTNIPASGLCTSWEGTLARADGGYFDEISSAWYAYGMTSVPADLKRAALTRVRYRLNAERSGIPDRAVNMVIADGGTFTLATPGKGGSLTGIPEVDAVLGRYSMRHPGVA